MLRVFRQARQRSAVLVPVAAGVITCAAIFTGLAVGMYLPSEEPPSDLQLVLAITASALSGLLAAAQTRSAGKKSAAASGASDHDRPEGQQAQFFAPVHLPADIADFTDRRPEIERITAMVSRKRDQGVLPLVAVAGIGGVGKTTLIVRAAHTVKGDYPDGVLFVNLRGAEAEALDPLKVLAAFLRALGVDGSQLPASLSDRAELFRARLVGKRALVVLDNAASETQIRPLLPDSTGCTVLISSRVHLAALQGAAFVDLEMLDGENAVELLSRIAGDDRVAADPQSAHRVAELVGCLPLGLRIAGAKLAVRPHLPLARLARWLNDERRLLTHLSVGDLAVESSLALSYQGLTGNEQLVFRRLGLLTSATFPGWVVGPLLDDADIDGDELMERLVQMQLLQAVGEDVSGCLRYRFHDLVRAFARERMRADESEQARAEALTRVFGAYLYLAEQGSRVLEPEDRRTLGDGAARRWPVTDGPSLRDEPEVLAWFAAERMSLSNAVEHAYETGMDVACWELAGHLRAFYDFRSHWDDWQRTYEIAVKAARRAQAPLWTLAATCNLANCFRDRWDWDGALQQLAECDAILAEHPSPEWAAFCDLERGLVQRGKCEWELARQHLSAASAVFQDLNDLRSNAVTLHYLGDVFRDQGRWVEAEQLLRQSLAVFTGLKDNRWAAITEADLGLMAQARGHMRSGITFLAGTVPVFERLADRRLAAYAIHGLGDCYREMGEFDTAAGHLRRCISDFHTLGDRWAEAHALHSLGLLHLAKGEVGVAGQRIDEAAGIFQDLNDAKGSAIVTHARGEIALAGGDAASALDLFEAAVGSLEPVGDVEWTARAATSRGDAHERLGSMPEAVRDWRYAHDLVSLTGSARLELIQRRLDRVDGLDRLHRVDGLDRVDGPAA